MVDWEDFVVQIPYSPKREEQTAIDKLTSKGLVAKSWYSKAKGIDSWKKHIGEHMYKEQNCRCAYCRIEVPNCSVNLLREHIVPKQPHPQWMFESKNICFACEKCNSIKKDKEVLVDPNVADYPTDSNDFKIVNPFYDNYFDHIMLSGDILYVGKTEKGKYTINTCKLFRPELAIWRAKKKLESEYSGTMVANMLMLVANSDETDDFKQEFQESITELVKSYKERNKVDKNA